MSGHSHQDIIVIDFDHTLFNTTFFITKLKEQFSQQFNIPPAEFERQRDAVKECCVVEDVHQFINLLPHEDKDAMVEALHQTVRDYSSEALHDDALPFFERHRERFDLHILTHGDQELQQEKVTHSGVPKYVDYTITRHPKNDAIAPLIESHAKTYFIDDKPDNIDTVKKEFPEVFAYFMKRDTDSPYRDAMPNCQSADQSITDLNFTIQ